MGSSEELRMALALEAGKFSSALKDAQAAMAKFAQTAGASTAPANQALSAMEGNVEKSIGTWKKGEVQTARTASFLSKTFSEVVGASSAATEGMSKLAEVGLEVLGGGGIFGIGLAAAGAIGWVVAELGKASAEAKKFADETAKGLVELTVKWDEYIAALRQKPQNLTDTERKKSSELVGPETEQADLYKKLKELEEDRSKGKFASFGWFGGETYQAAYDKLIAQLDRVNWTIGVIQQKSAEALPLELVNKVDAGRLENLAREAAAYDAVNFDLGGGPSANSISQAGNVKALNEVRLSSAKLMGDEFALAEQHRQTMEKIRWEVGITASTRTQMLGVEEREYALAVMRSRIKWSGADKLAEATDAATFDLSGISGSQVQTEKDKARELARIQQDQAINGRMAEAADAGTFDLSGVSASEVASEKSKKIARELKDAWSDLGAAMGGAFSALGNAIGGASGKFLSTIGEMIGQAIKFAIAMAAASVAQTPVIGGLMAAAAAVSLATALITTIASVPSYAVGTAYVPRTGLAMIHQGERIIAAQDNAAGGVGGPPVNVSINVTAMDGQSVYRTLNGSRSELARVLREAMRDGVM